MTTTTGNGPISQQEKVMNVQNRVNASLIPKKMKNGHQLLKLAAHIGSLTNGVLLANETSFKLQLRAQMLLTSKGATYGMSITGGDGMN